MHMVKYFSRFVFTCTKNSVLSLTLLNQTTQCHWYPGGKLLPDIDNADSDSAVSLIPQSQASQWHWQRWIRLRSVIDTQESIFSTTLTTLNQTPQCHWYPGVKLRNDIDNAESDSAVALIPRSQASQWHWQRKSNMLYLVFFSNLKRHHIILYTFYVSTVTQLDPIFKG